MQTFPAKFSGEPSIKSEDRPGVTVQSLKPSSLLLATLLCSYKLLLPLFLPCLTSVPNLVLIYSFFKAFA